MTDLVDMNRDENGKSLIQFSREPICNAQADSAIEYSTEQFALRELENLKLRALAHAFGLDDEPNMWFYLALKLAQLHYPEPKKAGRKLKWDQQIRLLLLSAVDRMVDPSDSTNGVNRACKNLAKIQPWQLLVAVVENPSEALRAQYYIAKDKIKK